LIFPIFSNLKKFNFCFMRKFAFLLLILPSFMLAQSIDSLTIEKIMSDPKWIGSSPSGVFWSSDAENIYFNWNPDREESDSLYTVSLSDPEPKKVSAEDRMRIQGERWGTWDSNRKKKAFNQGKNLYLKY